jgi:hypothetical protein
MVNQGQSPSGGADDSLLQQGGQSPLQRSLSEEFIVMRPQLVNGNASGMTGQQGL